MDRDRIGRLQRGSHEEDLFFAVALLVSLSLAGMDETGKPVDHGFFEAGQVQWKEGPPSLPAGAKFALLEGNPSQEGLFTMRLWLPDGRKSLVTEPNGTEALELLRRLEGEEVANLITGGVNP